MNKSISYIILLIAFPFYFTGCKKEVRPTSMTIKDSTSSVSDCNLFKQQIGNS